MVASVDKLTLKGRFLGVPPVNKELRAPNARWEKKLIPERSPLTDYPTESGRSWNQVWTNSKTRLQVAFVYLCVSFSFHSGALDLLGRVAGVCVGGGLWCTPQEAMMVNYLEPQWFMPLMESLNEFRIIVPFGRNMKAQNPHPRHSELATS